MKGRIHYWGKKRVNVENFGGLTSIHWNMSRLKVSCVMVLHFLSYMSSRRRSNCIILHTLANSLKNLPNSVCCGGKRVYGVCWGQSIGLISNSSKILEALFWQCVINHSQRPNSTLTPTSNHQSSLHSNRSGVYSWTSWCFIAMDLFIPQCIGNWVVLAYIWTSPHITYWSTKAAVVRTQVSRADVIIYVPHQFSWRRNKLYSSL